MLDGAKRTLCGALALFWLAAGCNPFAPSLDEIAVDQQQLLGDRRTLDGFFEWFGNAYELRDSVLYGQILATDFRFTFKDFSNGTDQSWDRETEMRTTYNMFQTVQSATLEWTNYVSADTTTSDTLASVERAFSLVIVQDEQNVYRGTGSARLRLVRDAPGAPWRIRNWFDESDF